MTAPAGLAMHRMCLVGRKALHFLVDELARYPTMEPLGRGELVTTGTLTEAMPIAAGQSWSTRNANLLVDVVP
jgi:hypothetical protein